MLILIGVHLEGKDKKIQTRKGIFELAAIPTLIAGLSPEIFALIFATALIGVGSYFYYVIGRGEAAPGNVSCASWSNAPAGYQDKITAAANKAGIQPALLGAIFLSEHNNAWTSEPDTNDQGPFQIPNKSDYAKFLADAGFNVSAANRTDWWNDFDTAALAAAVDMKNGFKWANLPTNSSNATSIIFAGLWYNTGPVAAQEWAKTGYDLAVPPPSKPDWGNAGTQQYAKRTWTNFQTLNVGCAVNSPAAGGSFIQTCQGSTGGGGGSNNVVVIDPGHGTKTNVRSWEGPDALKASLALQSALQKKNPNLKIVMTRTTNGGSINASEPPGFPGRANANGEFVENYKRAQITNENNAAVILHIHSDDGDARGYMLLYPGKQARVNPDNDKASGPTGGDAVTTKSTTLANTMSSKMKGDELAQKLVQSTSDFYANTGKGYGLLSYDAPLQSAAAVTVEMFGHGSEERGINQYAKDFDSNKNGVMDKMANGIADGVLAYLATLPSGSGGQVQTASTMTSACKAANLALVTAKDVLEHECKDGDGCSHQSGTYENAVAAAKKNNNNPKTVSDYAWWKGSPLRWGVNLPEFTDCGHFVSYAIRESGADPNFPIAITTDEFDYIEKHPQKYQFLPNKKDNLQPGDILFRGTCTKSGDCTTGQNGGGHILIYAGENSLLPGKFYVSASLNTQRGNGRGPRANSAQDPGEMGIIARMIN